MTTKPTYEELEQRVKELEEEASQRKQAEERLRESQAQIQLIVNNLPHTIFQIDNDLKVVWANKVASEMNPDAVGQLCYKAFARREKPCEDCNSVAAMNTEQIATCTVYHPEVSGIQGETYWEKTSVPLSNGQGKEIGAIEISTNVTERKKAEAALRKSQEELTLRNRIAQIFLTIPDEEMYGEVLEVILEAMESKYGIFGYIDEHGVLVIPSMTTDIWPRCQVPDKTTVYPPETWRGIWGRSLIDKRSLYANEGLRVPEGHVPIMRVLVVPIKHGGEVIGLLGVANKATHYNEKDRGLLETIAGHIAPILHARLQRDRQEKERKRAEEALWQSAREMRIRNKISEIFLTFSDEKMYAEVLQLILEALESEYGTFGYFKEDGAFVVPAMTREIYWDKCNVPDKDIIFERGTFSGIWGRAVKEKKTLYSNDGPFNTPKGHIPIKNTIATPIIYRGETVSAIHIANKATDYDEKDKAFLEAIADKIAPVLNARLQRDGQERERKRAEEELREAYDELERRVEERTAELRRLSAQLIEVQENERKRIALELHDSIGQSLAAIKVVAEGASTHISQGMTKQSIRSLENLVALIQQAGEEVRRIHTDLRPSLLDDLGIVSTISWFCREFEKVYSDIKIEKEIDIEEKEVPEALKIVIFRVLQEALNNVSKHSKADLVRISLNVTNGQLELVVEDNGQGFDVEHARSSKGLQEGFGVTGMKERTRLSGGSFSIDSIKGEGTTVRVSWECWA